MTDTQQPATVASPRDWTPEAFAAFYDEYRAELQTILLSHPTNALAAQALFGKKATEKHRARTTVALDVAYNVWMLPAAKQEEVIRFLIALDTPDEETTTPARKEEPTPVSVIAREYARLAVVLRDFDRMDEAPGGTAEGDATGWLDDESKRCLPSLTGHARFVEVSLAVAGLIFGKRLVPDAVDREETGLGYAAREALQIARVFMEAEGTTVQEFLRAAAVVAARENARRVDRECNPTHGVKPSA